MTFLRWPTGMDELLRPTRGILLQALIFAPTWVRHSAHRRDRMLSAAIRPLCFTSVRPLYFGSEANGTILGYVISGFAIDRTTVEQLSNATSVDALFVSRNRALAGSLPAPIESSLAAHPIAASNERPDAVTVKLGNERYLAVGRDLSARATAPLELIELKSLDAEETLDPRD